MDVVFGYKFNYITYITCTFSQAAVICEANLRQRQWHWLGRYLCGCLDLAWQISPMCGFEMGMGQNLLIMWYKG